MQRHVTMEKGDVETRLICFNSQKLNFWNSSSRNRRQLFITLKVKVRGLAQKFVAHMRNDGDKVVWRKKKTINYLFQKIRKFPLKKTYLASTRTSFQLSRRRRKNQIWPPWRRRRAETARNKSRKATMPRGKFCKSSFSLQNNCLGYCKQVQEPLLWRPPPTINILYLFWKLPLSRTPVVQT